MGEEIFLISRVLIQTGVGVWMFTNPESIGRWFFKSDSNKRVRVVRILAILPLINAARYLNELFK